MNCSKCGTQIVVGNVVTHTLNGELLLITFSTDFFFESGSASIYPEAKTILKDIANLFAVVFQLDNPFEIIIAGHTDNVPILTPQFPSNLHLSNARAYNVLWELINYSELDPGFFYMQACGEYRPIASNDTPEGRQMNRRIEIGVRSHTSTVH